MTGLYSHLSKSLSHQLGEYPYLVPMMLSLTLPGPAHNKLSWQNIKRFLFFLFHHPACALFVQADAGINLQPLFFHLYNRKVYAWQQRYQWLVLKWVVPLHPAMSICLCPSSLLYLKLHQLISHLFHHLFSKIFLKLFQQEKIEVPLHSIL